MRLNLKVSLILAALAALPAGAQIQSGNPQVVITPNREMQPQATSVRRISVAEARKQVTAKKAVIVDVRSAEQFKRGHIRGATNIPGSQLLSRFRELPFGKTIITYCA